MTDEDRPPWHPTSDPRIYATPSSRAADITLWLVIIVVYGILGVAVALSWP